VCIRIKDVNVFEVKFKKLVRDLTWWEGILWANHSGWARRRRDLPAPMSRRSWVTTLGDIGDFLQQ
jgi:hypothetical protein